MVDKSLLREPLVRDLVPELAVEHLGQRRRGGRGRGWIWSQPGCGPTDLGAGVAGGTARTILGASTATPALLMPAGLSRVLVPRHSVHRMPWIDAEGGSLPALMRFRLNITAAGRQRVRSRRGRRGTGLHAEQERTDDAARPEAFPRVAPRRAWLEPAEARVGPARKEPQALGIGARRSALEVDLGVGVGLGISKGAQGWDPVIPFTDHRTAATAATAPTAPTAATRRVRSAAATGRAQSVAPAAGRSGTGGTGIIAGVPNGGPVPGG